jgi:hypothetical protein
VGLVPPPLAAVTVLAAGGVDAMMVEAPLQLDSAITTTNSEQKNKRRTEMENRMVSSSMAR